MYILGVSSFYHDSAACLIKDGDIIAAAQEERFSRKKHDSGFPCESIKYCLNEAKISPTEINNVVFYEKPFLKFERLIETYLAFAPRGFKSFVLSMPIWIKEKLFQKSILINKLNELFDSEIDWADRLLFSEHHLSHAASAFYPSPFKNAAILTLDGVGEWTTTSLSIGQDKNIEVVNELHFPHSLGLLYSAFTSYTGFKINSGEYKLMGLAPYGKPKYFDLIKENIIKIADDGSFHLDMSYFNYATGLTMTTKKFHNLFGGLPRKSESEITQREMDLAASVQKVTEEIIVKIARAISIKTGQKNLCLAGGVALNCVANGILLKEKIFDNIWIQPAAGDAGGALGAALAVWHIHFGNQRSNISPEDGMHGSYLGPSYDEEQIREELENCGAEFQLVNQDDLLELVSDALVDEKAIGWMQGRMEFGPRALGARSIIADPRSKEMQKQLNLKVKYRESFRPFAPSILYEEVSKWFNLNVSSPYMLFVSDVKNEKQLNVSQEDNSLFGIAKLNVPRSIVPAITHVDFSARIQTVNSKTNSLYHKLITHFFKKTGCPILVNTSFNVRGEPIVCSPSDAFKCFMGTELDVLVIGNFFMLKKDQNKSLRENYKEKYDLD